MCPSSPRDDRALGTWPVRHVVTLARLGVDGPIEGEHGVATVLAALAAPAREIGPARLGRVLVNRHQAEAGLYLDVGRFEGALVGARAARVATEVELTVTPSSPSVRAAVWAVLALCLAAGLGGGYALGGGMSLALGLLVGCGVAVAIIRALPASRLSRGLVRGRSNDLARQLDAAVRTWLDRPPPG